jgi:hypothetical protein
MILVQTNKLLEIKNDGRSGDYGGHVTGSPCTNPIIRKGYRKKALHICKKWTVSHTTDEEKKQFTNAKYNYLTFLLWK